MAILRLSVMCLFFFITENIVSTSSNPNAADKGLNDLKVGDDQENVSSDDQDGPKLTSGKAEDACENPSDCKRGGLVGYGLDEDLEVSSEDSRDKREEDLEVSTEDSRDKREEDLSNLFQQDWFVFQLRTSDDVSFNRNWEDYKNGFGNDENFWLGLETLHRITSSGPCELKIDLKYNGSSQSAYYSFFNVSDESDGYRLTLHHYCCGIVAGDSLIKGPRSVGGVHNHMKFSTPDRDNDQSTRHCAREFNSGWWFNDCMNSNLNGRYGSKGRKGLVWYTFTYWDTATYSEMKVRPKNIRIY